MDSGNLIRLADIIIDYLNGYGLAESTGRIPTNGERISQYQHWLATADSQKYPVTRGIIETMQGDIATDFNLGLDRILVGIN